MAAVVRKSNYRHVFSPVPKRDVCFDGVKLTKNAWDANHVAVNPSFIAVSWEVAGGGAACILPINKPGKVDHPSLLTGHTGPVLDIAWNPFNDRILTTVSEDGYGKVWEIPEDGKFERLDAPIQTLKGHKRRVGGVAWNGVAANVLATSSGDNDVKVWDVTSGQDKITIKGHTDIIQSLQWNYTGDKIVTYGKDKKLRILDPRANSITCEAPSHEGAKGARAVWAGKNDYVISVGFSKSSSRDYVVRDSRKFTEPLAQASIDQGTGILMPFYDEDSNILYVAGKGDGSVKYFEVDVNEPKEKMVNFLSQYTSNEPTSGAGFMPKRGCNVNLIEIAKIYRVTGVNLQPLSFQVPRKATGIFQDDLYPDCRSEVPALTAEAFFGGETGSPKLKGLAASFTS